MSALLHNIGADDHGDRQMSRSRVQGGSYENSSFRQSPRIQRGICRMVLNPETYHGGQSAQSPALDHADTQQSTIPPRIMIPTTKDHGLIHPALVVVSAMAITSALLWWIMHP
jgi:hypothetical protein